MPICGGACDKPSTPPQRLARLPWRPRGGNGPLAQRRGYRQLLRCEAHHLGMYISAEAVFGISILVARRGASLNDFYTVSSLQHPAAIEGPVAHDEQARIVGAVQLLLLYFA